MPDYTTAMFWTAQQNPDLEQGSPNSGIVNAGAQDGYVAQSILVEDAIATGTHTSLGWLTRVFVPTPGTISHIDYVSLSGTPNVTAALYPASGPAGTSTPLAFTAATIQVSGALNTLSFNGVGSPSSVVLQGNTFYYLYVYHSTTSTVAACTGASAASMNPNLTVTTPSAAQLTSAITTVTASTTLTAATLLATKVWYGLR